jgi:NAD(P)-dependent dehydrogenase (short-subunit alcohol dehydrogenase family)
MRWVLITGCSEGGIGLDSALVLHRRGWRVLATARTDKDLAALKEAGLAPIRMEMRDRQSIETGFKEALAISGGRLDALFLNAGYGQPGALEDLSTDALVRQFETNLFGVHHLTRLALPLMRSQKSGRMVFHSSILGLVSLRFRGAYNASKYALEGYVDTLRLELKGSPISVSTLNTGPVISHFRDNAYRAFKREIDPAHSPHQAAYQMAIERFESTQKPDRFTRMPQAVTKRVIHALESASPKPRYLITPPTYLLNVLKRLLPTAWLDQLLFRAL